MGRLGLAKAFDGGVEFIIKKYFGEEFGDFGEQFVVDFAESRGVADGVEVGDFAPGVFEGFSSLFEGEEGIFVGELGLIEIFDLLDFFLSFFKGEVDFRLDLFWGHGVPFWLE